MHEEVLAIFMAIENRSRCCAMGVTLAFGDAVVLVHRGVRKIDP